MQQLTIFLFLESKILLQLKFYIYPPVNSTGKLKLEQLAVTNLGTTIKANLTSSSIEITGDKIFTKTGHNVNS